MSTPLTAREAARLSRHAPPPWLRHLPGALILVLAFVHTAIQVAFVDVDCTDEVPCTPTFIGPLAGGVMLGMVPLGWIGLRYAAGLLLVWCVLTTAFAYVPGPVPAFWVTATTLILVAIIVALALWFEPFARRVEAGTMSALSATPQRVPGLLITTAFAAGLAVLCAAFASWGYFAQRAATARTQAADTVLAKVVSRDAYELRVRRPDGHVVTVWSTEGKRYPDGSSIAIRVDRDGLAETVAEPTDDGDGWIFAGLLLPTTLGLGLRAWQRRRGLTRLFRDAQPVHDVYVHVAERELVIYPVDAVSGDRPVLELGFVPLPRDPQVQAAIAAGRYDAQSHRYPTQRARLYGQPAPGQWATIAIEGTVLTPTRPLRLTSSGVTFIPPYPWQR